ncbi:MAG: hypothetical protein HY369_00950 [Candidatus Aenigmarchaeota archaeon]|nr:hypothetical protein [Candidatus Aenigmarchaeota archaeon]
MIQASKTSERIQMGRWWLEREASLEPNGQVWVRWRYGTPESCYYSPLIKEGDRIVYIDILAEDRRSMVHLPAEVDVSFGGSEGVFRPYLLDESANPPAK